MDQRAKTRILIYAYLLSVVVAYWYGSQKEPKVEYKDKIVQQTDIKTIIKEIVRPDGTTEKVTSIVDNSTKVEKKTISTKQAQWLFNIGVRNSLTEWKPIYSAQVQRRLAGPFYVGASADTDKQLGLYLGMEF